jgi:type IV pilus assembly protein PilQ
MSENPPDLRIIAARGGSKPEQDYYCTPEQGGRAMPRTVWPAVVVLGLIAGIPRGGAAAAETPAPTSPNNLQAIDYALLPAGGALVKAVFTRPLPAPPGVWVNHHPSYRIAFDFPDTVSAAARQPIEVAPRGLRTIQVVQSGTRLRLVLNLDRPHYFETTLQGRELVITLRRRDAGAAIDAPRHALREVGFQRGATGESRVVVEVSDDAVPVEVQRKGNSLIVDFLDAQVPRALVRRLDAQDFGTPIRTIDTYPLGRHARMRVELAGAHEVSVYQFDRRLVLALP